MTVIAWSVAALLMNGMIPAPHSPQLEPTEMRGGARFVRDVAGDYMHFFSEETAQWSAVGGGAALAVHAADEALRVKTESPTSLMAQLDGGQEYGGAMVQFPLAVGWWVIGHAVGSDRGAEAGRDLLRAQISAFSWSYAIKYSVNRTRPNGDPRSFPSGHSSAVFATAMVLQEHYGLKLGVPAFGAAIYTAASRITNNKHWASDVTFGAFLGMACARTVTLHVRNQRLSLAPLSVPGGGGVMVNVTR